MGHNLGLEGSEIFWQGYGGMGLDSLINKLKLLKSISIDPVMLIVHCGGNNLGKKDLLSLRGLIEVNFKLIKEMLPNTSLVWSEILPRSSWRYSEDKGAMERCRKRINGFAGKLAMDARWSLFATSCVDAVSSELP